MQQDMNGEVFEIMVTSGNDILAPDTHLKGWYTVESWGFAEQGCDGPAAVEIEAWPLKAEPYKCFYSGEDIPKEYKALLRVMSKRDSKAY